MPCQIDDSAAPVYGREFLGTNDSDVLPSFLDLPAEMK